MPAPQCIFGNLIYSGQEAIYDRFIHFEGHLITDVSTQPAGEIHGRFDVVTPAFIDTHAHIGMARAGEPRGEAEFMEKGQPLSPGLDALDSVQMDDPSFSDSVESGVLYSCVVPGSGGVLAGRSAILRNYGRNTSEALIGRAGVKAALGFNPTASFAGNKDGPFTRMGTLAMLRKTFDDVQKKRREEVELDLHERTVADLLDGCQLLRVHVHRQDDIAALLRLTDAFDLDVTMEHTGDVHDVRIFEELARRKIAVNYGPIDTFPYKVELKHKTWRNLRHLLSSGVRFGLMSDHPISRQKMLLLQLRWFLRSGCDKKAALEIITSRNAEILRIEDILGSISKGKWASFVCWNGDPFDLTRFPVAVYGEGRLLHSA